LIVVAGSMIEQVDFLFSSRGSPLTILCVPESRWLCSSPKCALVAANGSNTKPGIGRSLKVRMLSLPSISAGFLKTARVRFFALSAAAIALGPAPPAAPPADTLQWQLRPDRSNETRPSACHERPTIPPIIGPTTTRAWLGSLKGAFVASQECRDPDSSAPLEPRLNESAVS
jgi:hypothetical protein